MANRHPVSHSQRVALRRYYQTIDPKPTQSELRAWFKSRFGYEISQSIVSRSLSDSFAFLDVCVASDSEYRTRNCQWPWIETLLTDWLEVEARSGKVSNKIIGRKAKQLWDQSKESRDQATPKFSTGWVVKFRRRYMMHLQPLPKENHNIMIPDNLSGENSLFSLSHRRSADTLKQALVLFSPQSEVSTAISSRNNISLDFEVHASARPTISSDHLIHLIQHNSYWALMSNKSLVVTTSLIIEASELTASIKQFDTKVCGGLTVIRPLFGQHIPDSLNPTQLQMNCAHTGFIDMFPFPKFRDNLIGKGVDFVPEELCRDLFGDVFPDYITPLYDADECTLNMHDILTAQPSSIEQSGSGAEDFEDQDDYTAGRKCLITWGDPWRVENWEVTPGFLRKWSWSLEGCDDLIQSSNRWRALRDERLIKMDFVY